MNNSKNLNDMQILFLKQIIDTLQLGVIPWVENSVSELKYNGISGKLISGIDRMLLNNGNKQANCYLSYQQVIKNRITILKGEHSLYNFSIKEPEGKCNGAEARHRSRGGVWKYVWQGSVVQAQKLYWKEQWSLQK